MREEPYIDIIQNLVDTNTKEDLEKKWLKIVDKFDDINREYIKNTTTPFILLLMDFEKGFTKDLQLPKAKRLDPEIVIASATGNVAKVYGLNSGFLKPGCDGDVVIIDAPLGGTKKNALDSLKNGDPCAVGAVISDGLPRFVGRSKNTPPTTRKIHVERSEIKKMFN